MFRPRTISHMAMKMLRLLKKRRESVSGDADDSGDDLLEEDRERKA